MQSTNALSKPIALARSRAPGAWQLPIVAVDDVVCTIVTCRVDWGNDAAAMRVVRREIGQPWLVSLFCRLEDREQASGRILRYPTF